MSCCTPRRAAPDPYRGVRLYHTCAAKLDLPYRVFDVTSPRPISDIGIATECSWHTDVGIDVTTGGICRGPACVAYAEARADDAVDV